jgi:hypothetical protein
MVRDNMPRCVVGTHYEVSQRQIQYNPKTNMENDPESLSISINIFTQDENIAAQYIAACRTQTDITPQKTCSQISRWLKDCASHQLCAEAINQPLPTRVIEVTTPKTVGAKGKSGRYAALSYCWGSNSQVLLLSSNLQSYTRQLDFDGLPRTIKHAILVTRSVNIPNLWVRQSVVIFRPSCLPRW